MFWAVEGDIGCWEVAVMSTSRTQTDAQIFKEA